MDSLAKKKKKKKNRQPEMGRLDNFKQQFGKPDGQEVSPGRMTKREQASW
jgi:hypothetical protein